MILLTLPIARNFWHLRDCAWPSRAAYASPRLIADVGRRSVVRGSNSVVDREEKKYQFSVRNYSQLESLSCTSISLDSPSTLRWMTSFCVCLSRISLSPRRPPGVTHPALTHSVTLSSQARSSSQFYSIWKVSRRGAFVRSTHELQRWWIAHKLCSLKADAIDKIIRKASIDPKKQANFLEDFSSLSRKTSTWEKTESCCEKARPRRKQTRQSWKETYA